MTGKFDQGSRYPDIVLADFGLAATKYMDSTVWNGKERIKAERFIRFTDPTYAPPK
jgi:hypothetical protein